MTGVLLTQISAALKGSKCLEALDVGGNNIDADGMKVRLVAGPCVHSRPQSGCADDCSWSAACTEHAAQDVCRWVLQELMTALEACESLRVLELGYNVFGAKGMQHLSDALRYGLQVRTSRPLLPAQQCAHCVTGEAQLIEFGAPDSGPLDEACACLTGGHPQNRVVQYRRRQWSQGAG